MEFRPALRFYEKREWWSPSGGWGCAGRRSRCLERRALSRWRLAGSRSMNSAYVAPDGPAGRTAPAPSARRRVDLLFTALAMREDCGTPPPPPPDPPPPAIGNVRPFVLKGREGNATCARRKPVLIPYRGSSSRSCIMGASRSARCSARGVHGANVAETAGRARASGSDDDQFSVMAFGSFGWGAAATRGARIVTLIGPCVASQSDSRAVQTRSPLPAPYGMLVAFRPAVPRADDRDGDGLSQRGATSRLLVRPHG